MSTESFFVLCRKSGLQLVDLETMTIGMCLDYIDEYIEQQNPKKSKARKASQSDFDSF